MYNNPYYYPYMNMANMNYMNGFNQMMAPKPKLGLFKNLSNIKWGEVLNNTQKTLNVINQAIPVYYQIKPIFSNVKSLGRLVSAFNEDDSNSNSNTPINETKKENSNNSPTFFLN